MRTGLCYWRFKGAKEWRLGYCTAASGGLYRMGLWNGDTNHGPYVAPEDVEQRSYS
jgi:hypothetical protein